MKHHSTDKVTHAEFKKRFMPLQEMLYREAYRMLCDRFEAEDAVQNCYMRLWEQRNQLDNLLVPEAFCRKIIKNICIDRWRIIRQHEDANVPIDDTTAANAPPDVEHSEAKEFLGHFLAGLPEQQQRVMRMKMLGCSFEEIAEVTGLSDVNVRVIISRIRKKFKESYYR